MHILHGYLLSHNILQILNLRARKQHVSSPHILYATLGQCLHIRVPELRALPFLTTRFQNLIPLLCIRPLRLLLSSETLRSARIILLKSTHLPFVGLIWAYENSRRFVSKRMRLPPPSTRRFLPARPLTASQAGLSRNDLWTPSASNGVIGLDPRSPTKEHQAQPSTILMPRSALPNVDGGPELVALIQKLSSQVEELTSMVAGQQKD